MRKTTLVLVLLPVVAMLGYALGVTGVGVVAAVLLGVVAFSGVLVTRFPTDRLLWITTCLFVLTVTWNGIRLGGGGAFGNAFMVLAFAALAAHVVVERRPLILPPWLLLAGTGLFFAQLLSLVFPPDVALTNKSDIQFLSLYNSSVLIGERSDVAQMIKFEVSLVMVPVLIIAAVTTVVRARRLLDLFAMSSVVSSLVAIADYSGLQVGPVPLLADERASGLTVHPNYLALGCTISIPLVMLWFLRRDPRLKLAGAVVLPILLAGVMTSGSRAGAVAAVTGVVGAGILLPELRRKLLIVIPIAGMIGVLVIGYTKVGHGILDQVRLSSGSDVAGSDYQRTYVADVALEQIRDRPVQGVGFSVIADAHSIYLELLAAGGIIALTSFLIFCGGLAGAARNALRGPYRDEVAVASLGIAIWLVAGAVGNELADKFLYVVPGVLLALGRVTALQRRAAMESATSTAPAVIARPGAGGPHRDAPEARHPDDVRDPVLA